MLFLKKYLWFYVGLCVYACVRERARVWYTVHIKKQKTPNSKSISHICLFLHTIITVSLSGFAFGL